MFSGQRGIQKKPNKFETNTEVIDKKFVEFHYKNVSSYLSIINRETRHNAMNNNFALFLFVCLCSVLSICPLQALFALHKRD